MSLNSILLIIAIVLVVVIFLLTIIQIIRKKRTTIGPIAIILLLVGVILLIPIVYSASEIKTAEWVQIILTIGLLTVTAVYAASTEKQAKANIKMAEEMREQRLGEDRPYLLIRLEGDVIQWDKTNEGKSRPSEFSVTIRNVGKGPAINLWAALWRPMKVYFGDSKGYLASGEEWNTTISRANTEGVELGFYKEGWLPELSKVVDEHNPATVAVKYKDVHGRFWATYLVFERHVDIPEFVIEKEQDIMEVFSRD